MDGQPHKRDNMLKDNLPSRATLFPTKNYHGLLYADPMTIDERSHIK
jgi:hypothetical protein